ncbi:MAG: YggS family pyridoxal phosphate-dependent enzyme [Thermoanaerobaculia bacterium]
MADPGSVSAAERLAEARRRIEAACQRAGRRAEDITLVGAAKRQPLDRLEAAVAAGLRHIGENRAQEARAHRDALPPGLEWHLIGPLQSNKVHLAVELFDVVHSVDRPKIARLLEQEAAASGRTLPALLEVNLGEEASKHGFAVEHLAETVEPLAGCRHLQVMGLMAIPPFEEDPERSRPWFRRLRELRDALFARPEWSGRPGWLSMGMSHDYEVAIEEGATHVRVGTALFGPRD